MKIIFLDIDGVLNSERWYKHRWEQMDMKVVEERYPFFEFDPDAVARLNRLVQETGAQVVISSTWRMGRSIEELQKLLDDVGFTGKVIDKTPFFHDLVGHSYSVPRGCEIDHWLKERGKFQRINWSPEKQLEYIERAKVKNYVILDDDSDMLYNQREHFIKTPSMTGLTDEHVDQAIEILNTPLEKLYYSDHVSDS